MNPAKDIYRPSLALLTDLYGLTMAYAYWKSGRAEDRAVFHLSFRSQPFGGGYTVCCGLSYIIDFLTSLKFEPSDLDYLRTLPGNDGSPLFEEEFIRHLSNLKFDLDIDAVREGTVVFPHEPLVRVTGPLLLCQLMETPFLNFINFQSLVATKAARICQACKGEPVLEFGARRAQGIDGAITAARAAFIGGCAATSNVLAGRLLGIPVKGTFAHSWVMAFDSEPEAFEAYARAMPNNCVFLVDTYDSIAGVKNAISTGLELRKHGHEIIGIRLDSGDLAQLSTEARELLDDAGFGDAAIIATNDLDENTISGLKEQGAAVSTWGVGTRLVTAYDQPALDGIYKLGAIRRSGEGWKYKVKLSEQPVKTSTPGILQIRRYCSSSGYVGDMVYDIELGLPHDPAFIDSAYPCQRREISSDLDHEDLLTPVFRAGKLVYTPPSLEETRNRCTTQLAHLHPRFRRQMDPHAYPCGLEENLFMLKESLILEARRQIKTEKTKEQPWSPLAPPVEPVGLRNGRDCGRFCL
ncbi:MAG: nicotinate phosphoribosyltransferase [Victivallales bacterium]|jgi:nicotinate phosphoribosyltransferase